MKKVLVVVADGAHARIFIAHGPHELSQIAELAHRESQERSSEITNKEGDMNTCPYEDRDNAQEHEKKFFAKDLAKRIEGFVLEQHLTDICLIAPAKFVGDIHKNITYNNFKLTTISKDLTSANESQILKELQNSGISFLAS